MNNNEFQVMLKSFSAFKGMDESSFELLVHKFELENFPPNKNVINQGEFGDKIYFIYKGSVEVFIIDKEGHEVPITTLHEGNYFGELALLSTGFRSSSVRTLSTCKVFSLTKQHYIDVLDKNPILYKELNKLLSERLQNTLSLVADRKTNTIILMIYNDEGLQRVKLFEDYLKKIISKQILILDNINSLEEMMEYNNKIQNHYIIIKNRLDNLPNLNEQADHIVNFTEKNKDHLCLLAGCTQWNIEHTVRLIMNKTIGIALCSGGAPAMAHLGVLNALQEHGIPLDYIVGTSAGAFYGACYSFGIPLDQVIKAVVATIYKKQNVYDKVKNFSFKLSGLANHHTYEHLLESLFGNKLIEDANLPFAAVASDIYSGATVVIKNGSVTDAILASNSAPILLEPFRKDNLLLIDGAATAPLPIQVLLDEKIDIKIAVPIPQLDLNVRLKRNPKLLAIYIRSRSMMVERMSNLSTLLADVIIMPKVEGIRLLDWTNTKEIVEAGRLAASEAIKRIQYLLNAKVIDNHE